MVACDLSARVGCSSHLTHPSKVGAYGTPGLGKLVEKLLSSSGEFVEELIRLSILALPFEVPCDGPTQEGLQRLQDAHFYIVVANKGAHTVQSLLW